MHHSGISCREDAEACQRSPLSLPGSTGQSSIPETSAFVPIGRGVLDRPVKPGDDIEDVVRARFRVRCLKTLIATRAAAPFRMGAFVQLRVRKV
jgi:hypothetical protein